MTGLVDSHHHLWSLAEHPQTWMDPATDGAIMRDFSEEDLAAAVAGTAVTTTVVVQSVNDADETSHLLERANRSPYVAGVVGWADLTAPDLGDQLDRWREGAGGSALVGLRHLVQNEIDPGWLDRPQVRTGLRMLGQRGLSFDLLVREPQLPAAVRVVQALPDVRFVLDHLGKPPLRSGRLDEWTTAMHSLGTAPNLVAKISGLVTEADPVRWTPADLAPALTAALETFGPHRLMFGSDWPVCLLATDYATVLATVEDLVAGVLSPDERQSVFAGSAREFYGLSLTG